MGDRRMKKDGLYIYNSLPKLFGVSSPQLRQWIRTGVEDKLERAILAGQGRRLLAQGFLIPRHITNLITKCDALHNAVEKGSLLQLQVSLELLNYDYNRQKFVMCLDEAGVGLLHKAVFYNYKDIVDWLVNNYPQLVHQKDSEGRTPLHYTAACRDEATLAGVLERAGAVRGARDAGGRTLADYRVARTLLALPDANMPRPGELVIKRHNIRIWCHECDMRRLQRVVWEGQGARLLSEVSSQPIVKKFLEAVPYIMNTIRDIHNAVIQNDLEGVMKLTADPVPPQALSSRDANNLTAMHKAAGLGHGGILKYIIERYPEGINDIDNEGRTPLHYAAVVKDEQHTYNTLVRSGADESAVDNKNRTPAYYINRPQDIDKNIFKVLPEAPRTPSSAYPSSWDWKILDTEFMAEFNKKSRKKNLKASNENISSKNNTMTISENLETNGFMKNSSTHELISNLPDLNDTDKSIANNDHKEINTQNKDTIETEDATQDEKEENVNEVHEVNVTEADENLKAEETDTNEVQTEDEANDDQQNYESSNGHKENETEQEQKPTENIVENNETNQSSEPKGDETKDEIKESFNEENSEKLERKNYEDGGGEPEIIEINDNDNIAEDEKKDFESENKINDDIKDASNDAPNSLEVVSQLDNEKEEEHEISSDKPNIDSDNDDDTHHHDEGVRQETTTKDENGMDKATSDEGNDNLEDDDDVQVQGSHEHDIHTSEFKQRNGSAMRGTDGRISQENPIEGIISSDAELETEDASIRDGYQNDILIVDNEIDPEVTDLINTANMEMLATLVLNGEGSRLIGRQSGNTELQAFLNNVPTYMQKINRVHIAAREGNIRDLQAALDRRKFAIARDPISANGATPLHVATIFGKTNIIKYLGGRFPETLSAVDFEGRTALHYAAVLPDNGHYFNILQQLGANAKDLDDNGRSAEDYCKNPMLFPFNNLLSDFGISEEESKAMFGDKGISQGANGHMDIPIFHTEEGRYLAKSLGDPLIKGLTEVANIKPKDPVAFLASFLHNFPEHEKPRPGTQESNVLLTNEAPEVENDQAPYKYNTEDVAIENVEHIAQDRSKTAIRPKPIDVITLDPKTDANPDGPETAVSSSNRDEHGQSMLHFAAARSHTNNALFQLLQETNVSLGYRDELYRTARDVSIQANVLENTGEIDRWVLHLAARGNKDKIMELLLQGYDHILDVVDEEGVLISEVVDQRGDIEINNLLASIPTFEESRESLHSAIRRGALNSAQEILSKDGGHTLARAQNALGRNCLHIAVLAQHEDIVEYLADTYPELLRLGDNLERTALHYAMGVEKMESLSRLLIKAGAKRVLKDLKGRQPSYYFMNKSDILRLKEEEEAY